MTNKEKQELRIKLYEAALQQQLCNSSSVTEAL